MAKVVRGRGGGGGGGGAGGDVARVGFSAESAELVKTGPCGMERPGVVGVAGS
jgi:hypothetical protein